MDSTNCPHLHIENDRYFRVNDVLAIHVGAFPDHIPLSWHVCAMFSSNVKPGSQLWLAVEPKSRSLLNVTCPLHGAES